MTKKIKIGMVGTAGTGRSAIALQLSNELEISFLSSRSITSEFLEKYNYGSGMIVEKFLAADGKEIDLIEKRLKKENEMKFFITDRTLLDHFAYLLLEVQDYDVNKVDDICKVCKKNIQSYDKIFYFAREENIVNNGVRTVNKWFQVKIDCIIQYLLNEWQVPFVRIDNGSIEDKLSIIHSHL